MNLQVNSLIGFSKDNDVPIISSRNMNSVVNARHGDALVTGGLDRVGTVKSRVGIPGPKDIPVVRVFFSKETERRETTKIIVTLVPRMNMGGDAEGIEAQLREFRPIVGSPKPGEIRVRSKELSDGFELDAPKREKSFEDAVPPTSPTSTQPAITNAP